MPNDTYLVTIGSVVLSDDGTGTGKACLTKVEGLTGLFLAHQGATRVPLSGTPFNFVKGNLGKGVRIIIKPFSVTETVLDSLKTIIDTANTGASVIAVKVEDGPLAVDLDCDPLFENGVPPINWTGNFFNSELYDVEIRLITRGFTP